MEAAFWVGAAEVISCSCAPYEQLISIGAEAELLEALLEELLEALLEELVALCWLEDLAVF